MTPTPIDDAIEKRFQAAQGGDPTALAYVPTRSDSRLNTPEESKALLNPGNQIGRVFVGAPPVEVSIAAEPYIGVGRAPFTKDQQAVLGAPLSDTEIHIRPDDGNLYLPGVYYRRRLNEAFGIGGWGLVPVSQVVDKSGGKNPAVFYGARLYVLGRFVAESTGKGTWIQDNAKSDYGTALESAKTDALTRCCKDIGIATELWDPDVANGWRAKHCLKVKNPDVNRFGHRAVEVWVRRDDPSFTPVVRPAPPPNVPELSHSKETGAPIMGNWPREIKDPSAEGHRELDDAFRRIVGAPVASDLEVLLQRSIDENTIEVENKKTGELTREVKALPAQLARIHILVRELQITEENYRFGLKRYYGVDTSGVITKAQANDMILRLERARDRVPSEMLRSIPPEL